MDEQEGAVITGAVIIYQKREVASWGKEIKTITTTFFFQQLIRFYFQNMCAKVQVGKSGKHFVSFYMQGKERREKPCTKLKMYNFLKIRVWHQEEEAVGKYMYQKAESTNSFCFPLQINYLDSLKDFLNLFFLLLLLFLRNILSPVLKLQQGPHTPTQNFTAVKALAAQPATT